jgi:hypothetical protein
MNPTAEPEVQTVALELMPEDDRQLTAVVEQQGLSPETASNLKRSFASLFGEAHKIIGESQRIVVTDASQKLQMKLAKDYRIALKNIRVAGDKKHKELKEESLRRGKSIDGFKNILIDLIATEENRLEQQEKFVEVEEEKRKAALKAERTQILMGLQIDPNLYQVAEMTEQTFQQLVEGTKLARTAEAERKRKEEADRIERETKEAEERERIRLENERLKKEAEAKEAILKAEREHRAKQEAEAAEERERQKRLHAEQLERERHAAAEEKRIADERAKAEREAIQAKYAEERKVAAEKARKEKEAADKKAAEDRAAREKAEATLKAHRAAEAKRLADEEAARKKAAAAPDKDRLINYANAIRALEIPEFSTPEAKAIATTIQASRDKFASWVEEKAGAL